MRTDRDAPAGTMSTRAYIATKALEGLLSNPATDLSGDEQQLALTACDYADWLLAALNIEGDATSRPATRARRDPEAD